MSEFINVKGVNSSKTGDNNVFLDYTNRRKVEMSSVETNKSNEQRKQENEQELVNLCLKIEECSISKGSLLRKSVTAKSHSATNSTSSPSSYPEVEEFQKFLDDRGGHYGGWKVKDHLFFVKARSKYPLDKTAEIVNETFADISSENVIAHNAWYIEYVRLRAANKRAIEEWKKTQKPHLKVEEKQKEEPKPQNTSVKRDPNVKQKIEIWRAHSLAAALKSVEEQKQEEKRKKKEEDERKKKHGEKRALINRYREEKLSYEMAMKTAQETERLQAKREAALHSATLLKYFRYEDRRFTERMKAKRKEQVKEEPKRRSVVGVKRDPNRLLQPTMGWIYHTKRSEGSNSQPTPLHVQHLRKLLLESKDNNPSSYSLGIRDCSNSRQRPHAVNATCEGYDYLRDLQKG